MNACGSVPNMSSTSAWLSSEYPFDPCGFDPNKNIISY